MIDFPGAGYDAWKLATPPEYERECCECKEGESCEMCDEGASAEAAYDAWVDQKIDEARDARFEREP